MKSNQLTAIRLLLVTLLVASVAMACSSEDEGADSASDPTHEIDDGAAGQAGEPEDSEPASPPATDNADRDTDTEGAAGASDAPDGDGVDGPAPEENLGDPPALDGVTFVDPAENGMQLGAFIRFQLPSENIACVISEASQGVGPTASCQIGSFTFAPPEVTCEGGDLATGGDFGFEVVGGSDGYDQAYCATDTMLDPDLPVLDYDQAVRLDDVLCFSSQYGVTCRNDGETRHGFQLARSGYLLLSEFKE